MSRLTFAVAMSVLAACSGGGGGASGPEGTYKHPEEGTIVIEEGGTATLDQSGDVTELTWEQSGDAVTFSFEDESVEATLDGSELTFEVGDFSGDEPAVFVRE